MGAHNHEKAVYAASHLKRKRATKDEIEQRRARLLEIVAEMAPMTVRQVFYQAEVQGLVEKSETGYDKVQRDLVHLRRAGRLAYDSIVDNTRWQRKPRTFDGIEDALQDTARLYRKNLWIDAACYCEVWIEKDALAGVLCDVTEKYDVPLMTARGFSSLSFLQSAADYIASISKPAYIYHFGDSDPSGACAAEKIEQGLRELAPEAEIHFECVAVTVEQIEKWNLPTRPTKTSDSRAKTFNRDTSVELDAIPPSKLRDLCESVINRHLPQDKLRRLQWVEQQERSLIKFLTANTLRDNEDFIKDQLEDMR
jgi:hypothetical protein